MENVCKSVAFPNISTGVYGYPKENAARVAVESVAKFPGKSKELQREFFVCFDEDNYGYIEGIRQTDSIKKIST